MAITVIWHWRPFNAWLRKPVFGEILGFTDQSCLSSHSHWVRVCVTYERTNVLFGKVSIQCGAAWLLTLTKHLLPLRGRLVERHWNSACTETVCFLFNTSCRCSCSAASMHASYTLIGLMYGCVIIAHGYKLPPCRSHSVGAERSGSHWKNFRTQCMGWTYSAVSCRPMKLEVTRPQ